MSLQCPCCYSKRIASLKTALKVGAAVGTVGGGLHRQLCSYGRRIFSIHAPTAVTVYGCFNAFSITCPALG
jgi:hypothetical protein